MSLVCTPISLLGNDSVKIIISSVSLDTVKPLPLQRAQCNNRIVGRLVVYAVCVVSRKVSDQFFSELLVNNAVSTAIVTQPSMRKKEDNVDECVRMEAVLSQNSSGETK